MANSENDSLFLERVYSDFPDKYLNRLRHLGVEEGLSVLDVGCGFGQWTLAMGLIGAKPTGIDLSSERLCQAREIADQNSIKGVQFHQSSAENLPFEDNEFDYAFSYSVLNLTDYRKVVREMVRVVRPGGRIYISANSWGWYLENVEHNRNHAPDFDPRKFAIATIRNTLLNMPPPYDLKKGGIVIPPEQIMEILFTLGCVRVEIRTEGQGADSFLIGNYQGLLAVYEVLASVQKVGVKG